MALDIPVRADLRMGRCLSEALSIWAGHIPILFLGSLLAAVLSLASLTLFLGSLYAGLSVMILRILQDQKPSVRDLFSQLRRFIRFFTITIFIQLFLLISIVLISAIGIFYGNNFPFRMQVIDHAHKIAFLGNLNIDQITQVLLARQTMPLLVAGVILFVFLPGLVFVVKCFYMYLLAADRGLRLDEAYVESRKAVERYGFWKHLGLIVAAVLVLVVIDKITHRLAPGSNVDFVMLVLFTPLSLGIVVSAYEQTLGEERRQWERYKQKFVEMRDELQTAHDMQMSLLPQAGPKLPGYHIQGTCIPANSVGGDYFTYRWLDEAETQLAIVVADVSGKAMEAAVVALRFSDMLRYECRNRTEPADILDGLNASLEGQIDLASFITCCIAVLDVPSGTVRIANAGHCPPYHHVGQSVRPVNLNGYPLGLPKIVRPKEPYAMVNLTLNPGDRLVLYSDGVIEAQNARAELFDDARFVRLLQNTPPTTSPDRLIHSVVSDVKTFIGKTPRTDDFTLVVLQRTLTTTA